MKKLPLGIQTLSKIIEQDLLFVDKTEQILKLINSGQYYFISRPRRFGKSLLISTLEEIFSGNKELFKDLFIYDKIEWNKYPVIRVDFSVISFSGTKEEFVFSIKNFFDDTAKKYEISLEREEIKEKFHELFEKLSEKGKVVLLIDEYDKPLVDHITDQNKMQENREVLREFYSVIKYCDKYIKFLFITGVSKFTKVSIFSGLNNLLDITLDYRFSTIAGLSQSEVEKYFDENIQSLCEREHTKKEDMIEKIKFWYNGYSWDGVERLYNPFSILSLFSSNAFRNYWFTSGTPAFLIKLIREKGYSVENLKESIADENIFESYDIDNLEIRSLLFQTGYLTIKEIRKETIIDSLLYVLTYPNYEVRESLMRNIFADYTGEETSSIIPKHISMMKMLKNNDLNSFIKILENLFAKIPYTLHIEREAYYHSLFYMVMEMMGLDIDIEVLTDKGRVDGILEFDDKIFVIEFKYGREGESMEKITRQAIQQIKEKRYYEKYLEKGKEIQFLGTGFIGKEIGFSIEKYT